MQAVRHASSDRKTLFLIVDGTGRWAGARPRLYKRDGLTLTSLGESFRDHAIHRSPLLATLVRQGIGYNRDGPHPVRASKLGGRMDVQTLIIWLIVGAMAGWLAGMVVKGGRYGLIGDIIVGIIGGFIAGWLLPQLGIVIGTGIIAAIINAFVGAVILLLVLRLVKRGA
jgi:uncharacterized membrane protein YeaQ/YmgE (transglycosylase-associated protein family)